MNEPNPRSPFRAIRSIDYTVIFVRDMAAMRRFYEEVLCFRSRASCRRLDRLPDRRQHACTGAADAPTPAGSASLQLAFKVSPGEVDACAAELVRKGVALLSPPTDQPFGHRTLFFRDPNGNLLEIYAEI